MAKKGTAIKINLCHFMNLSDIVLDTLITFVQNFIVIDLVIQFWRFNKEMHKLVLLFNILNLCKYT